MTMTLSLPYVLTLLLLLAVHCHGFVPLQSFPISAATRPVPPTELHLFQTRSRVQKIYRLIKQKIQKKEIEQYETDLEQAAFVSAVQEQLMEGDDFQIAVHYSNHNHVQFIGTTNDTATSVNYDCAVATIEALKDIEESYVLADIPTVVEHPQGPQGNPQNGLQHHPLLPNGKVKGKTVQTNGEALLKGESIHVHAVVDEGDTKKLENKAPESIATIPPPESPMEISNNHTIASTVTTTTTEKPPQSIRTPTNLYSLPPLPLDRQNLTKLEIEFRNMLEYFCQFTQADLYTLRDPRLRAVMQGVISGSNEYPVYRAFEVLYEDLPPLRVAGRMIYAKLKDLMNKARAKHEQEVQTIAETTGLPLETVEASRLAFLTLAIPTEQEINKEAHYLTVDQLVDTGLAEKARMALGHESSDEFLNRVNETGRVTFAGLMEGLQAAAEASCAVEHCDPAAVLQSVVEEMEPTLGHTPIKQLDKKRQDYSDQYDRMVQSFKEWDDIVPEGKGRRLEVLRGCFVGAANDRVVEALRVVYLDYAALRMAGNSIYALMKQVVAQIRRNRKAKDE